MSISRMFTVVCDECTNSSAGEWYKSSAIRYAQMDGWRVTASTGKALCPECVRNETRARTRADKPYPTYVPDFDDDRDAQGSDWSAGIWR